MSPCFYAIKHLPSGRYLPPGLGHGGRGFTHVEPENPAVYPPRLFLRKQDAKTALSWWLKGKTTVSRASYSTFDGSEIDEDWHTEPKPDRIADAMAVVQIKMVLP